MTGRSSSCPPVVDVALRSSRSTSRRITMLTGRLMAASCFALLLISLPAADARPPRLNRGRGAAPPLGETSPPRVAAMPVRSAAWIGVSTAAGSQALLAFAALPRTLPRPTRDAITAMITFMVLLTFDAMICRSSGHATAVGRARIGSAIGARTRAALATASQATAIVAAGWACASVASVVFPGASAQRVKLMAGAGGMVASGTALRALREPITEHLLVPFVGVLAFLYDAIFRQMGAPSLALDSWASLSHTSAVCSVCAFATGLVCAACLAGLVIERRSIRAAACAAPRRRRAAPTGAKRNPLIRLGEGSPIVGLEPVAQLALCAQLFWTAGCLLVWSFSTAPPFGFALLATATCATRLGVHELAKAGPVPAQSAATSKFWAASARQLSLSTSVLLVLASWRAFWFPEPAAKPAEAVEAAPPFAWALKGDARKQAAEDARASSGGRAASRLERHFLGLVLTFVATAGSGAFLGDERQAIGSICAVVLTICRTLVESIFHDNKLALGGALGLLLGGALLGSLIATGL